jgi:F-type H+-transporting ATPase subunit delta
VVLETPLGKGALESVVQEIGSNLYARADYAYGVVRYEDLVKEHLGRVEVEVTTAVELTDDEVERIKERLARSLEGREVILQTSVDPNILGGAVFRFGGRMIDSSIRGRLASLREEMLERSVV